MPGDHLTQVQRRVEPYEARISGMDEIADGFRGTSVRLEKLLVDSNPNADAEGRAELAEISGNLQKALDSSDLVDAYLAAVPCVEAFVASELDVATASNRGLGRVSNEPPRFGAAFRKQIAVSAARDEFGRLIEQWIFDTYAGTAAALLTVVEPPIRPRVLPATEVFERWVPRMYMGTQAIADGSGALEIISGAHRRTEEAIEEAAEHHGLLGGLRSGKRRRVFNETAAFWAAAGAALFWAPALESQGA